MRTIHRACAACLLGLAGAAFVGCGGSSDDAHARIQDDLEHIRSGLMQYAADNGRYPEDLNELESPGNSYPRSYRRDAKLPRDPWGAPYGYVFDDGQPVLLCLGADHAPGGHGRAADHRVANLPRMR
jgi:hypothetical protein